MISEKVMTNFNVLCLRVLNWVVGNLDGAFIVAVEWHFALYTLARAMVFFRSVSEIIDIPPSCFSIMRGARPRRVALRALPRLVIFLN